MRFLADMGVSMTTVRALRDAGEEVSHLREQALHTMPDDQILTKAGREGRVLMTFDLDFGELLAAAGSSVPSVVLFRLRNQTPAVVTSKLLRILAERRSELQGGAIIIVEDAGYRLRRLPIR